MHRWLAGLTFVFVAVHVVTLLFDTYAKLRVLDVLVPFASSWRPTALAVGILALYLLVAVEVSALAMKQVSKRWWRDVHILSYVVFWGVSIHAALAGTDASKPLYIVTAVVALRRWCSRPRTGRSRTTCPSAASREPRGREPPLAALLGLTRRHSQCAANSRTARLRERVRGQRADDVERRRDVVGPVEDGLHDLRRRLEAGGEDARGAVQLLQQRRLLQHDRAGRVPGGAVDVRDDPDAAGLVREQRLRRRVHRREGAAMPSACSAVARVIASSVAGSLATTRSGARAAAARACSSITSGVLSVGW